MLILIAGIYFYTIEDNAQALKHELSTEVILRPAINFGNDLLFSGTIIADSTTNRLIRGKWYNVAIEMPTVENEGYNCIKHLVNVDAEIKIQLASRIIGYGRINDFAFE